MEYQVVLDREGALSIENVEVSLLCPHSGLLMMRSNNDASRAKTSSHSATELGSLRHTHLNIPESSSFTLLHPLTFLNSIFLSRALISDSLFHFF